MADDQELVREILQGNMDSFNILVYRYEAPIFRFVFQIIKDSELSRDVTQEVFITMYNKLYTFKGQCRFRNWLYQIARNKSYDFLRKHKKALEIDVESAWTLASDEPSPEQRVELIETRQELRGFIDSLEEVDRQILLLKGMGENMKFTDIAEILKLKVSSVKTRYYRLWDKYMKFSCENKGGSRS